MVDGRAGEDREPQVTIGHVVIGFLCEYVAQLPLLLIACDGKESFDLSVVCEES